MFIRILEFMDSQSKGGLLCRTKRARDGSRLGFRVGSGILLGGFSSTFLEGHGLPLGSAQVLHLHVLYCVLVL